MCNSIKFNIYSFSFIFNKSGICFHIIINNFPTKTNISLFSVFQRSGKFFKFFFIKKEKFVWIIKEIEIFDPEAAWKRKTIDNYYVQELLVPIVLNGEIVYETPSMQDIQNYCKGEVKKLWDEVKRFENPHNYYVDLSQRLWDIKQDLLKNANKQGKVK